METPTWSHLYPFESHFSTTMDGHRLHYVDEGNGHPVVMLHGNPTWSFMYRNLIPVIAAQGQRALAVDLIGCGLSEKPQTWPYHLEDHLRVFEHWIDNILQLNELSIVMHDWGGGVGMGYAVRHPEKIRRLVLMNTAAFPSHDCPKRLILCRIPLLSSLLVRGMNALIRTAERKAIAKPLQPAVQEGFRYPYRNWHDRIAVLKFPQDIPLTPLHPTWRTLSTIRDKLPRLDAVPKLFCWGEQDFCFTMRFFERFKAIFPPGPNACYHSFPQAAHYLLEDAGDAVIPLLCQFLRQQTEALNS